jgi:hypothetical protein
MEKQLETSDLCNNKDVDNYSIFKMSYDTLPSSIQHSYGTLKVDDSQSSRLNNLSSEDNLLERINKLRTEYATTNKRGIFFNTQYKQNCATEINNQFDIDTLMSSTLFILPNSHHVYFDYPTFKTFAIPELYEQIVGKVIQKMRYCLDTYGACEVHININSFSISAFHRYKPIIELYSYECNNKNQDFYEKIKKMHVYNIPSTINAITTLIQPILNPLMREKIVKYDKESSIKPMQTINEILGSTIYK